MDDDARLLALARIALAKEGMTVATAESGAARDLGGLGLLSAAAALGVPAINRVHDLRGPLTVVHGERSW